MQSILLCELRSNAPAKADLAIYLPAIVCIIEQEWRQHSWASFPTRPEHDLLRSAHLALAALSELKEGDIYR